MVKRVDPLERNKTSRGRVDQREKTTPTRRLQPGSIIPPKGVGRPEDREPLVEGPKGNAKFRNWEGRGCTGNMSRTDPDHGAVGNDSDRPTGGKKTDRIKENRESHPKWCAVVWKEGRYGKNGLVRSTEGGNGVRTAYRLGLELNARFVYMVKRQQR